MGKISREQLGMNLLKKDQKHVWHPFTPLVGSEQNLVISRGEGATLYTVDGRAIIDAIASWWVNLHGHGNTYIANAVSRQAAVLEHVMFAGFTHEPAIQLAENLLSILPENQSKVFFSDNGSTAVEVALKMALQYWHNKGMKKKKILALDGAYHGDTFGAMSVGERGPFTTPFWPFLFQVEFIDLPEDDDAKVLKAFESIIGSGEVAAFIFEPLIQGASGMRRYSEKVLDKMILVAQEASVLCIADEVMTGFGRTGKLFASNYLTNKPDIFCLSKGLTGGTMALGATTCTQDVQEAYRHQDLIKTFFHGHSYTANPIACAAANASFDLLITQECQDHIQRISLRHHSFQDKISAHPKIRKVSVLGTILVVEFKSREKSSYINEARHQLYSYFLSRNVLLRPLGNIVYVLPPYIITDSELDLVYHAIWSYLEE